MTFALLNLKGCGVAFCIVAGLFIVSWFLYLWTRLIASAILRSWHEYRMSTTNNREEEEHGHEETERT